MNSRLTRLALFAGVIVLGWLLLLQWRTSNRQRAEIERLQASLERLQIELKDAEGSRQRGRRSSRRPGGEPSGSRMDRSSTNEAETASTVPAESAASGKENQGIGGLLATMMQDPDMRRMVVRQQKTVLENLYAPLFKELGLSEAETGELQSLMLTNQLRNMERAGALMKGMEDPATREATLQKVAEQQKEGEVEIKSLLGEERFARYRDFNETMGERVMLQQFKQQMLNATPLRDDQEFQLQRVMREEAKNLPFAPGEDNPGIRSWSMMVSDEAMEKQFQRQEEINKRVLARAQAILNDEQIAAFEKFQRDQIQMQRMGVAMARRMMGTPKPPAAGPDPAK